MTFKFWSLLIILFSYSLFLLCTAFMTYILFYQFMIPTHQVCLPVHFDFTPPHPLHHTSQSTQYIGPTAYVHVQGEKQWRYLPSDSPAAAASSSIADLLIDQSRARHFIPGHSYNIDLEMNFPDSQINQDVGVITVEIAARSSGVPPTSSPTTTRDLNPTKFLLASSVQSFLPRYTSPLVRWMWSWVFAFPLVTGLIDEKQSVTMVLFDSLLEQESAPISDFVIQLKSPAAYRFQLYSARLKIQVQLHGLRYFMYHYPLITGGFLISLIYAVELFWSGIIGLVLVLVCCSRGSEEENEAQRRKEMELDREYERERERERERQRYEGEQQQQQYDRYDLESPAQRYSPTFNSRSYSSNVDRPSFVNLYHDDHNVEEEEEEVDPLLVKHHLHHDPAVEVEPSSAGTMSGLESDEYEEVESVMSEVGEAQSSSMYPNLSVEGRVKVTTKRTSISSTVSSSSIASSSSSVSSASIATRSIEGDSSSHSVVAAPVASSTSQPKRKKQQHPQVRPAPSAPVQEDSPMAPIVATAEESKEKSSAAEEVVIEGEQKEEEESHQEEDESQSQQQTAEMRKRTVKAE